MHTDKNRETLAGVAPVESAEESREETLSWLLDMDMSEPEERLFAVDHSAPLDTGLTEYELEVASRPMTRGSAGADNLENYVDEEIIISSETQSNDIYTSRSAAPEAGNAEDTQHAKEAMAIDYSRDTLSASSSMGGVVAEGVDILGLAEDDDMGEKFLVIKRVKPSEPRVRPDSKPAPVPSDARALRLVSPARPEQGSEAVPSSAPGQDVLDYVAAVRPPSDETAFDNYLLQGKQLEKGVADVDELTVEQLEGVTSYDTGPADAIEYHDDFQHMADPGDKVLERVTQVIPQLMAEIEVSVRERLVSLGLDSSAVQAELKLGNNLESVVQLLQEGFEPVIATCTTSLATLQELRQSEVDAIFVRLVHHTSGENCNLLFTDDFVPPETLVAQQAQEETVGLGDQEPSADLSASPVFAEALFSVDDLDDMTAGQWQPDSADIDDAFADFGEEMAAAGVGDIIDSPAQDGGTADVESEYLQVFEDDIFAEEFAGEVAASGMTPQADIDALFDSLGLVEEDADEICGLDVREFSPVRSHIQLVAQQEETAVSEPVPEVEGQLWCIPAGIKFSQASPGGGEIFADFLEAFIEEGSAELEKLEDAIVAWEKDVTSEPAYTVVTRILHTIKGIAKGVGLHYYGALVHNFETLLAALPRPQAGAEADYYRIINAWLDACVRGLDHIQDARVDIANALPQPAGQLGIVEQKPELPPADEPTATSAESAAPAPVFQAHDPREKQLSKKIADDGARVLAAQQSVRITSEKLDDLLNLSNQAQQLSVRTAQSVTRSKRASSEMQSRLASVRAHIAGIADRALRSVAARGIQPGAELDALEMDQYSELQEAANILREGVEDLADLVEFATRQNAQVEALLKQQTKVISSIGSSIRGARVVPVSRLIPGLRRLVRTVSVDLDKTVSFQVLNELGTLDRDDYARCQTILDHMVRNALDHGIEPANERLAAGKTASGQVTIDIRKAGADAIITLADDGRGIDPEKMRESACRKGLDVDVDALTDDEAVRLIFHKGFSTAGAISQISGRGVGMDIVLSELQEMGGDIRIESVPGKGTAFHIRVPSSITVNGALLVSAGEHSYAIPLGGVIAVEQVPVEEFFAAVQNNARLPLSGMDCEPAYLATLCRTGHSLEAKTWRTTVPVIIAGSPERRMAIAVDDVDEALELVIRSLGPQFSSVPGVAGAATTAAGEAIVALDLNMLVASVGAEDHSSMQIQSGLDEGLLVMVVDDSRTQRMVATSQLDTVGVETITAENGAVAIDILNSADRLPDIILMDVEMPVKDGIQALREIRKSVRYGHVPVIMITSRTGLKHRAMAQAAGCNGYMGKPFNFRMLIGQINELTGHRLQLS